MATIVWSKVIYAMIVYLFSNQVLKTMFSQTLIKRRWSPRAKYTTKRKKKNVSRLLQVSFKFLRVVWTARMTYWAPRTPAWAAWGPWWPSASWGPRSPARRFQPRSRARSRPRPPWWSWWTWGSNYYKTLETSAAPWHCRMLQKYSSSSWQGLHLNNYNLSEALSLCFLLIMYFASLDKNHPIDH